MLMLVLNVKKMIVLIHKELDHRESKEILDKYVSISLTMQKPLIVLIATTVGNSQRDGNTRPYLSPEKPVCTVKKQ